jgi:hypothetical protein
MGQVLLSGFIRSKARSKKQASSRIVLATFFAKEKQRGSITQNTGQSLVRAEHVFIFK